MDRAPLATLIMIVAALALCAWVVACSWRRAAGLVGSPVLARIARIGSL